MRFRALYEVFIDVEADLEVEALQKVRDEISKQMQDKDKEPGIIVWELE